MNYRHIYHAGNFADVMKHLALILVLDYLKNKEAGFCVIDAHGGIGLYDLQSEQAQKTGEWLDGIARFENTEHPEDFKSYYRAVSDDLIKTNNYPGSPLLSARNLRTQDRLIANELHPEDFETLRHLMQGYKNTRVTNTDAYECIRGHIPPAEKRGVVLIDPPFEKKEEFKTLITQMKEWKKRFPNGIYMIWYPIKPHLQVDDMKMAATELGLPRTWCFETMLHPRYQTEVFNGCGLMIFNAPYQIPERIEAMLPYLKEKMGLFETSSAWLSPA